MADVKTVQVNESLKCGGCGAMLFFKPGTLSMQCDHCGQTSNIEQEQNEKIISVDLDEFISGIAALPPNNEVKMVVCTNCGSQTVMDAFLSADKCAFCTSPLVVKADSGRQYVPPHYVLPFDIGKEQGIDFFNKWLKGLWWAPNDLAKKVNGSASALTGVYLPYFTYDTDTTTHYTGERGQYYYTDETYTETVNGQTQTKTRRVRHTSWSYASGTVNCEFKNLEVPASHSLPAKTLQKLGPWNFGKLKKFNEQYLSGFRSETYQVSPESGFEQAQAQTVNTIHDTIRDDIGGDEQRINDTDTDYNNNAVKYLLLPAWVSAYTYNNKLYQFTINASTGEVIGERPLSAIKIVMAILLAIALIAAGVLLLNNAQ
ncbi:hypothetical protein [Mucilaginibacter auburnensis]|uniref:LSD1 subclass zinc finger protein n=1 Tax=Mucilaginibacter auburnensis TaxID=1457233 RepID=A0A2H9VTJ3_9SPHI|nr:hypothetical protein [Mucilaginibacter auburnensis]PJJ84146.1 LSD1 subclass zinc finger protein [Mucilaginibacter auburnensis]